MGGVRWCMFNGGVDGLSPMGEVRWAGSSGWS